ncbi:putative F-box protein At1g65770 [Lycium barbarum]|uniref:putative F-box protein At1g65770 n=1 Tax=Lycium barbarum TaxID=112863 RepID=UPI00293E0DFE|nr:putative F-box protein At1g65770 [Lycium barbarum]
MHDWSELQHDLLVLIVRNLNLIEDYLNFGTVCKSWHSHTEEPRAFIKQAVLSANPSHTSDYILMVISGPHDQLCFWRPGDLLWTNYIKEPTAYLRFTDVVYSNCQFYAVTSRGRVQVFVVIGHRLTKCRTVAQIANQHSEQFYILESLGSLFVVMQSGKEIRDPGDDNEVLTYGTTHFHVYRVNLAARKLKETRDIGDRSFFLGANASLSVQAAQFPGIKPNHIYFTDNWLDAYIHLEEGGGLDMGVFNIADGSVQPHYDGVSLSLVCPPIWVTPTPS